MAQTDDQLLKDLSSKLMIEYLKRDRTTYEHIEDLFEKSGNEDVLSDECVVVTVYKVKRINQLTVREAAGLTPRSSVNRCKTCGKPL